MAVELIDDEVRIPVPESLTSFASTIFSFYQKQEMVDANLSVGGKKIGIHKPILCAASEFFEKQFEDPNQTEIELKNCDYEDALKIIEFIYTGKFDLNNEKVESLLPVISDLKLKYGVELFGHILSNYIGPENCCKYRMLAKKYNMEHLLEKTKSYLQDCMDVVAENDPQFVNMPLDDLYDFVEDDEMKVPELKIYNSVVIWLKHDPSRKEHAEKLVEHIRYINIPKSFMQEQKQDDFVQSCKGLLDLVNEALEWYDKPNEIKRKYKNTHTYYRHYERLPENDDDLD